MQRIKYRISLDMLEVASQTTIKAKKGDTACSIVMTLTENGKIYHIADGCRAVFSGKKSDGNYLFNGETCRIEDNTIIYDFTEQTVAIEGVVECEVILYKDNEQLTTPRFNILVGATVYNGEEIVSTPEADALKEFIEESENRVNSIIDESENVIEEVGEVHRNSNQYFANAINGIATNIKDGKLVNDVVITDTSSLEHNINVKVDNANAKVIRTGKNLYDQSAYPDTTFDDLVIKYLPDEDCIYIDGEIYQTKGFDVQISPYIVGELGESYTLSIERIDGNIEYIGGEAGKYANTFLFTVADKQDTSKTQWLEVSRMQNTMVKGTKVLTEKYISQIRFYITANVKFDKFKIRIQLEKGTEKTDYERFVERIERTPDEYGNLTVPSAYPTTILSTDTKGVTINAGYNVDVKKYIDKKFAALQTTEPAPTDTE